MDFGAAPPDIERYEADGDNRRKYRNRQRPIDMPLRAPSNRQNGGQGFQTDFAHLVLRSVLRGSLVRRTRSSHAVAAPLLANFGSERALEIHDSSVVWFRNSLEELASTNEGNF
jgi:hypothetical protein